LTDQPQQEGVYLNNAKLISILIGVVGFFITVFCGFIYTQEQSTQAQLTAHMLDAANQKPLYVRKDDLGEINARLQRIEEKLDQKADKTR